MAPKRASRLDAPPAASSPQDSEGSDSGSESESESVESDSPKGTPVAPTPPPAVADKTANSKQQSSSEGSDSSGSETDGESESESDVVAKANPKPISTKPMQEAPKSKQPRSKAAAAPAPTSGSKRPSEAPEPKQPKQSKRPPAPTSGLKRSSETPEPKQSKRPKEKAAEEPRPLFQRIWSDDDEIAILEGMIAYTAQKGESPVENMNVFFDFIKKSLKVDVSKRQLKDKVSRLNKRYATCVRKGDKYKPVKAHDVKIFDLLMKVWGGGDGPSDGGGVNGLSGQPKLSGNAEKKVGKSNNPAVLKAHVSEPTEMEVDKMEFDKGFAAVGFSETLMKEGMKLISADKRAELNAKWKELHVAELELLDRRSQLISKQTSFVLQLVKSANH